MTPRKFFKTLLMLFIGLGLLVILGGGFAWSFTRGFAREVYEREVILSSYNDRSYALENLERNYEKLADKKEKVFEALPKEKESQKLLSFLEENAAKSGIKLTVFQYRASNEKKKVESITDPLLRQTKKTGDYYELSLNILAEGSYEKILQFTKILENSDRLIQINRINIIKIVGEAIDEVRSDIDIVIFTRP